MTKNFSKVLFSFFLLLIFVLPLLIINASAETMHHGDFSYEISNGEIIITNYSGNSTDLTIPNKINNYPVTSIGAATFINCSNIVTIEIPVSIKNIEKHAFYGCVNIKNTNYYGSKSNWDNISIDIGNETLLNSNINYVGTDSLRLSPNQSIITSPDTLTINSNSSEQNLTLVPQKHVPNNTKLLGFGTIALIITTLTVMWVFIIKFIRKK